MQKNITLPAAALALALASPWAAAQTVWRCGNSYSQQPCPGGNAVATADGRTPAEALTASRIATEDARRAEALQKARLAQERNAPKALVIGPQAAASAPGLKPVKDGARTKAKAGKPDQFTAVARAPGEKKKKTKKRKKAKA